MTENNTTAPMIETTRYFLVFYTATANTGQAVGNFATTTNGNYLNMNSCLGQITETDVAKSMNLRDAVFTNIIELSKSDYEDWIA